jgi:hypothetical protein
LVNLTSIFIFQGSEDSGSSSPALCSTPKLERKFLGLSLSPFGSNNSSLESLQHQFQMQQKQGKQQQKGGGGINAQRRNKNYVT